MWSVGSHPFSAASPGGKITQAQLDMVHRKYLIDTLDAAIELVNKGIGFLVEEKLSSASFEHILRNKGVIVIMLKEFSKSVEL